MIKTRLAAPAALMAVSVMTLAGDVALCAQELVTAGDEAFDIGRALLREGTVYEPFVVTDEARPLRDALDDGTLQDYTLLLVIDHPRGKLALVRDQMAYHHVAQGEIAGEPWMVSF